MHLQEGVIVSTHFLDLIDIPRNQGHGIDHHRPSVAAGPADGDGVPDNHRNRSCR